MRIDPSLPGVFRSELERHGPAAADIFSGSHPGSIRDLFSDRRHAFFAQAAPVVLGPLPADELTDYLVTRFRERSQAAVARLVGDGHLVEDDRARTGWRIVDPFLASWLRES